MLNGKPCKVLDISCAKVLKNFLFKRHFVQKKKKKNKELKKNHLKEKIKNFSKKIFTLYKVHKDLIRNL
jgi:uncharacterized protein YlxW (UPF0749 family)